MAEQVMNEPDTGVADDANHFRLLVRVFESVARIAQ